MRIPVLLLVVLVVVVVAAGCSQGPGTGGGDGSSPAPTVASSTPPHTPSPTSDSPVPSASGPSSPGPGSSAAGPPARFRLASALAAVDHLALTVGPRHGTSPEFRRAARWVAARFRSWDYDVRREGFAVPGGTSWGVPVRAGRSLNVVATPPGFDPTSPHVVVGAHLDTVPQAPGAEDNASGVGVLLAVARAVGDSRTRLPVVLVAFGAEEPRGPGDDDHHYGSRHHVAKMPAEQRGALRGMVSLDRVGVGDVLPICSAAAADRLRGELAAAAERAGVRHRVCEDNRASDHWSFVRAGLPGVRLGSTPYAGYHSPADVPAVVEPAQLRRAGRAVLAWLTAR